MKVIYQGPFLAVEVEDVPGLSVHRGEAADVPDEVAARLLEQGDWQREDQPAPAPDQSAPPAEPPAPVPPEAAPSPPEATPEPAPADPPPSAAPADTTKDA